MYVHISYACISVCVYVHVQYLTLLSLHTITVLPLTTVYFVSEVYCTLNVLYLSTMLSHTNVK